MLSFFSSKIKLMVGIAAIAFVIAAMLYVSSLKSEKNKALLKAEELQSQVILLQNANKQNLATIENLLDEKQLIEQTILSLEAGNKKDRKTISSLQKKLKDFEKDPANKVELSPVLKDTITNIEKEREKRRTSK